MKTSEETRELKQENETLTAKLKELTEDETAKVTGGIADASANLYFTAEELSLPAAGVN